MSCCQDQNKPQPKTAGDNKIKREATQQQDLIKTIANLQQQQLESQDIIAKIEKQNKLLKDQKDALINHFRSVERQVGQNSKILKTLLGELTTASHVQSIKYIAESKRMVFDQTTALFDKSLNKHIGQSQQETGAKLERMFSLTINHIISGRKTFLELVSALQITHLILDNGSVFDQREQIRCLQLIKVEQPGVYTKITRMLAKLKNVLQRLSFDSQKLTHILDKLQHIESAIAMQQQHYPIAQAQPPLNTQNEVIRQLRQQLAISRQEHQSQQLVINALQSEVKLAKSQFQQITKANDRPISHQQLEQQAQQQRQMVQQQGQSTIQSIQFLRAAEQDKAISQFSQKNRVLEQTVSELKQTIRLKEQQSENLMHLILVKQQQNKALSHSLNTIEQTYKSQNLSRTDIQSRSQEQNSQQINHLIVHQQKVNSQEIKQPALGMQEKNYLNRQLQQLRSQNSHLKVINSKLSSELEQSKQILISRFQSQESSLKPSNHERIRSYSFIEHKTLFIGDLLERRKEEKKFLIDSLQSHMHLDIETTKILYNYQRDRQINFHKFIDGHSNLVLVVQTSNAVFAGYYSGILQQKGNMEEQALIISMNNRECYKLNNFKNNPKKDQRDTKPVRGMMYEKFHLIYGNAQIRLKTGQKKVFSNFGIPSGYFDNRTHKVDNILGEGTSREVQLLNYEIHEVVYAENYEQYQK